MIKQLFTLSVLTILTIAFQPLQAQVFIPGDSVYKAGVVTNTVTDGEIDAYIYYHNTSDTSQTLLWRLVSHTAPAEWGLGLCDNIVCYYNGDNNFLYTTKQTDPVPADDTMFFKMVFNPNCITGTADVKVFVNVKGNAAGPDTLTYKVDADATNCTTGINDVQGSENISLFPNPTTNALTVKGLPLNNNYRIDVLDIQGRILMGNINSAGKEIVSIKTEDLVAGFYFIRVSDIANHTSTTRTFSRQ